MGDDFDLDFDTSIEKAHDNVFEPETDLASLEEVNVSDLPFSEQEMLEILNELSDLGIEPLKVISELETSETSETQDVGSIHDWICDINPNFDPLDYESPYNINCGSCALAVWNRLNGGDMGMVASAENINYNHEMEDITGLKQVEMNSDAIKDYMLAQGPGANGIVGIDRAYGPGHWFNVYNDGGRVVAIDGQTGSIVDWPPQDLGDVVRWELSI